MIVNGCIFCNLPKDRILFQSRNFYICLSEGPLIAGHILLVASDHVASFTNIDEANFEEFRKVRERIKQVFLSYFSACQLFEHGNHRVGENNYHSHAHLQVIPAASNHKILEFIDNHKPLKYQCDYSNITNEDLKNKEYLYYESLDDLPRFYVFSKWPRKYFVRHMMLESLDKGFDELNWELNPRTDLKDQTSNILKNKSLWELP